MARDDDGIDRLLARGRLSGGARERILARALAASAPRRRSWRRWLTIAVPATAALLLVVLWPRAAFTPKGAPAGVFFDVTCADGSGHACARGATLLFHLGGVVRPSSLAAWAEPDGGGERIWYFPAGNDDAAVAVPAGALLQTLGRGVRIGPEHAPGRYTVHLVLSQRPLTRAEALAARAGDIVATATVPLEVLP